MVLERLTVDEAEELLQLPRTLGVDPSDGETIIANNGRYGPYVQKGKDFRNITNEEQLLTVTLDQALEIFAQPKVFRRGGAPNMAAKGPLREFGNDPVSGKPVVAKDGKFGVYVTDGETNASLSKGDRLEAMPARAGLRAARDSTRGDHRKRWRPGQEGAGHQEGGTEEGCAPQGIGQEEHLTALSSAGHHHAEHAGEHQCGAGVVATGVPLVQPPVGNGEGEHQLDLTERADLGGVLQ